jgi:hypothetical protein
MKLRLQTEIGEEVQCLRCKEWWQQTASSTTSRTVVAT